MLGVAHGVARGALRLACPHPMARDGVWEAVLIAIVPRASLLVASLSSGGLLEDVLVSPASSHQLFGAPCATAPHVGYLE